MGSWMAVAGGTSAADKDKKVLPPATQDDTSTFSAENERFQQRYRAHEIGKCGRSSSNGRAK